MTPFKFKHEQIVVHPATGCRGHVVSMAVDRNKQNQVLVEIVDADNVVLGERSFPEAELV